MVQVLYSSICRENHTRLLKEYFSLLDQVAKDRTLRCRRWQDAQLTLLGRLLIIKGLEISGLKVGLDNLLYSPFGKPYFDMSNCVFFNVSHSEEIVVCAYCKHDVGIDIEYRKAINIEDFRFQMSPNEWQRVQNSGDKITSFYKYWTEKEAVIKAVGMGLSIPLTSFEVVEGYTQLENRKFFVHNLHIKDGYECAVSCSEKIQPFVEAQKIVF